jgi:chromosome segregation ATPase
LGELDLTTAENARLTESLVERGAALDNARARIEFLETALSAAEAECSRLAAEIGGASERHRIESDALRSLIEAASSRDVTAETLLAEAKQRLNARSAENDAAEQRLAEAKQRLHARSAETGAAEQRLAEAKAAYNEADSKNRQLQKSLGLRQRQVEELEQSRLTLIDATNALLETFQDRDRALTCAEETIKSLTERNAQLEAKLDFIESHDEIHRPDTPLRALDDADEGTRKEWAELARHLATLVKLKRRSSGPAHGRSLTLLAGTVTF